MRPLCVPVVPPPTGFAVLAVVSEVARGALETEVVAVVEAAVSNC